MEAKFETIKLLKAILVAILDGKPRETKVKILKDIGLNKLEILDICGPSKTTLRTRKHRGNGKEK